MSKGKGIIIYDSNPEDTVKGITRSKIKFDVMSSSKTVIRASHSDGSTRAGVSTSKCKSRGSVLFNNCSVIQQAVPNTIIQNTGC